MSHLTLFNATDATDFNIIADQSEIVNQLANIDVILEQWQANAALSDDASQDDVLAAYADEIERLNQQYGFSSVDVVALGPDHPQKAEMRAKFLSEHTHADFEIRFFVDGDGMFYIHKNDRVYAILCEKGDLISVPANTTHWFDMGSQPSFKCIRFFTTDEGWLGDFTGSDIAEKFPTYDQLTTS